MENSYPIRMSLFPNLNSDRHSDSVISFRLKVEYSLCGKRAFFHSKRSHNTKKFFIFNEIRRTVLKNKILHCFKRRHSEKTLLRTDITVLHLCLYSVSSSSTYRRRPVFVFVVVFFFFRPRESFGCEAAREFQNLSFPFPSRAAWQLLCQNFVRAYDPAYYYYSLLLRFLLCFYFYFLQTF